MDGAPAYGILDGDRVRAADDSFTRRYADLRAVLDAGVLAELPQRCTGRPLPQASIRFLPTIPNPDKVICVGVNYRPHVEEMGRDIPEHPVLFVRFAASQVGHLECLLKPAASEQFDFEGELAVVIGRRARHVSRDDAWSFIAGVTCFMDGSVRDWQRHTMQFTAGKNFLRSGSMGPWLATPDELPEPEDIQLETRVNGSVMQKGRLTDLIFPIPELIEYCSTFAELLPGDVIATGTPGGVGAARKPPVWLGDGDRVEIDIAGVGTLINPVCAE